MSQENRASRVGAAEIWVSYLLRAGVIISLVMMLIGTVLTFAHHREYFTTPSMLQELTGVNARFPRDLRAIAMSAFAGHGRGWVLSGLFVLICTPVLRVALTLVIFLFERDRAYVILSAIVLALLTISFILGKAGG